MFARIKAAIRTLVHGPQIRFGQPPWVVDCPPDPDDAMAGQWIYHAPQMANRHFSPRALGYSRGPHGEDQRVKYIAYFLDLRDMCVLELGPLEGHHTILMEKMGAARIVAIEGRSDNISKCLAVRNRYKLDRTMFVQQDIERLASGKEAASFAGPFDLVFCCGLLYHVPDPLAVLCWCRKMAPTLFLGTHYMEPESPHSYPGSVFKPYEAEFGGHRYAGSSYREGGAADPLSGLSKTSFWPTEDALVEMLYHAGYSQVALLGKDLQNGFPHATLLAK